MRKERVHGFGRAYKRKAVVGFGNEGSLSAYSPRMWASALLSASSRVFGRHLLKSLAEVEFLGKFIHPNLVKLLGYCWEDQEFLLVYEYMQEGSLENHLFKKGSEPLPWETRIKIVIGAAQGLAFLHSTKRKVIYRDFKSSNVLLDGEFNTKLSDFGLAKLGSVNGESYVSTMIVGTYGYAAPEYMITG
ncbi:probable serine/threonine-protein kinase PIX13 [Helianthus annuus]|uniref:probable serine/threonine-protein kinase PIX13 n=1 Tax=Helianthus annuus TaxID=4232 RepID=UPI0016531263|nr:probable serine/threonine-protein kinase PIX13 [Helianthus annuus]